MALFKHILDFKRAALARLKDKRKAQRYYVGPAFPLKARIVLQDSDGSSRKGKEPPPPDAGRNWGGSLFNMSGEGLSLQLPPAAIARRGEETSVTLSLDGHELTLPCKVAHFRVQNSTAYCGLALDFPDQARRISFMQLLEAVALGSTLAPAAGSATGHDRPGLRAERYKSARPALLTAWRDAASGDLAGFELVLRDHCLRGEARRPALEIFSNKAAGDKTAWSAPGFALSNGVENGELRQLFRWVALNTSRTVPTDLREMMRFFAHARDDWKAPPGKK
ncbi:MAG: PilZ domain-containing protein [Oleiharenicola lentus]